MVEVPIFLVGHSMPLFPVIVFKQDNRISNLWRVLQLFIALCKMHFGEIFLFTTAFSYLSADDNCRCILDSLPNTNINPAIFVSIGLYYDLDTVNFFVSTLALNGQNSSKTVSSSMGKIYLPLF